MDNENHSANEYISLGTLLMMSGEYSSAIEHFTSALENEDDPFGIYLLLGAAYEKSGDTDNAALAYSNAQMSRPDSPEPFFRLGMMYRRQEDYRKAIINFNKAEALGCDTLDLYIVMADIFMKDRNTEQAIRCLNRALKKAPLNEGLWAEKIRLLIESGKTDSAAETLEEFHELMPGSVAASELTVRLYCLQHRYNEALACVKEAQQLQPDEIRLKLLELDIYVDSERDDEAAALIEQLRFSKHSAGHRETIAQEGAKLFIKKGRVDEAIKILDWGLEENNDSLILLNSEMIAYMAAKNPQKAIELADRIIAREDAPPYTKALCGYHRAMMIKQLHGPEQAKAELTSLANKLRDMTINNPGNAELYAVRLLCHCELGEYDKAMRLADFLQKTVPLDDSHNYPALVRSHMEKHNTAGSGAKLDGAEQEAAQ